MVVSCTGNESNACWQFLTVKHLDSVLIVAHIEQSDTWRVWLCESKFWATDVSRNSPSFLHSRVLTNSEFTTAPYWTLLQAIWIPSILSLRIYSDLCFVLIVILSLGRSLKLSPSLNISDEINICITHLCCSFYVTNPRHFSWYYQVHHLQLAVTCCTTSFNFRNLCPHSAFIYLYVS